MSFQVNFFVKILGFVKKKKWNACMCGDPESCQTLPGSPLLIPWLHVWHTEVCINVLSPGHKGLHPTADGHQRECLQHHRRLLQTSRCRNHRHTRLRAKGMNITRKQDSTLYGGYLRLVVFGSLTSSESLNKFMDSDVRSQYGLSAESN